MKKFLKALAASALAAGAVIIFGAWGFALPRGTRIDGVDVGGMSRTAAVAAVRDRTIARLKANKLVICAGENMYTFAYPEFNFTDDLPAVAASVRRKGDYTSHIAVYLNGAERIAGNICSALSRAPQEPYAVFNKSGDPFTYYEGSDGASCDSSALLADISASLNGGFSEVRVRARPVARKTSVEDVKRKTSLICRFTTRFDSSNAPRSSNIALACSKINGLVLSPGQSFSFNGAVGARTEANGFRRAKIISGGQFVEGVGGGVCQVSTTIYNAAVLCGLEIEEYHPHSLKVSYVDPSRDAMVSGTYFDLKFRNTRSAPIYIRMNVSGGALTCCVYGEDDGVTRTFVSRTLATIPKPGDIISGDGGAASRGAEGAVSEGYLIEEKDGKKSCRLIRSDRYAAAPAVRARRQEDDIGNAAI